MCWEMDYRWLAEQKEAEERQAKQKQRVQLIENLLSKTNPQSEKRDAAEPAKEIAPAK